MFMALDAQTATDIQEEFKSGTIRKEYLARVRGCFPEEEITVDQPLLTVDRQSGLVVVAPEDGKEAKTIFKRIFYDAARDQSVVQCKPITGRSEGRSATKIAIRLPLTIGTIRLSQPTRSASTCSTSVTRSRTTPSTARRMSGRRARPRPRAAST
jgi:hypothetical protein